MRTALALACLLPLLLVACADDPDGAAYDDALAEEHADDAPVPTALGGEAETDDVVTANPVYARFGDEDVTGYLARPDTTGVDGAPALPGLLVIHEWWGLNDNVRTLTERLAAQGYVALAVDLYEGEVAETPDAASSIMGAAMENPERLERNIEQAITYLQEQKHAGALGVIGWCFGGGWALRSALAFPGPIDATVIYYGQLVTDRDRLQRLDMPVLALFGGEDSTIPQRDVEAFRTALDDLGIEATVEVYEGAGHAFANPSGERYVPEAAEDAWQKTTAFLAEHLEGQ